MQKWITTEGIFAVIGVLWFLTSSLFPAIPNSMPLGLPVPGVGDITFTPALFIAVAFVPIVLKTWQNGKTPFVNTVPKTEEPKDA